MKKHLAILFLFIFSFQVLPVRVLGKLLGAGQNMEEVQCDSDSADSKVIKIGEDQIIDDYHIDQLANRLGFDQKVCAFIHMAESLPSVHVAGKLSPPPDHIFHFC